MNRKKESKIKKQIQVEVQALSRWDDPDAWLQGGFEKAPWSQDKIDTFQKDIDSAFGGENAIVLVWSADRRYGDTFLNEKDELETKPPLMFGEFRVNATDYCYLTCPRWLLMEVIHGSQLEASWEASSFAYDDNGTLQRIRPEKPPKYFYSHLRILADHEHLNSDGVPTCCERLWQNGKRICYGKYREPNQNDIAYVRKIRERMDRDGVAQRNDTARDANVLLNAQLGAKHFMQQTAQRKSHALKEFMMANSGSFFQGILDKLGSTMTPRERDEIVLNALNEQDDKMFSERTII